MTKQNRARTRAVRATMAATGQNYTRAAAPADQTPTRRPRASLTRKQIARIDTREYEMFGRVTLVLRRGTHDFQDTYEWLDHWQTGWAGGGWVLEWTSGPFAFEMADFLIDYATDRESGFWLPSDVTRDPEYDIVRPDVLQFLRIGGVPFQLRAVDPIGVEKARAQRWRGYDETRARRQDAETSADSPETSADSPD